MFFKTLSCVLRRIVLTDATSSSRSQVDLKAITDMTDSYPKALTYKVILKVALHCVHFLILESLAVKNGIHQFNYHPSNNTTCNSEMLTFRTWKSWKMILRDYRMLQGRETN